MTDRVSSNLADTALTPAPAATCLGRYVIEHSIGAGGMGEVFRAQDTLLGRTQTSSPSMTSEQSAKPTSWSWSSSTDTLSKISWQNKL